MFMGCTVHKCVCICGDQRVLLRHQDIIVAQGLGTESLTGLGPPYIGWAGD